MRMGATEPEERAMLMRHLPELFSRRGDMLYIGANQIRPPHHASALRKAGWRLHLLEIFPGNVEHHTNSGLFASILLGDIRTVTLPRTYDVAFWWHGIEHIEQDDLPGALAKLEEVAPLVVLGCPNGHSPQATVYGNEAEQHRWDVQGADLARLGYNVKGYEPAGRKHLLAWKRRAD